MRKRWHVSPITYYLSRLFLWLTGWKPIGDLSSIDKAVAIGAFHTSNWDGIFGFPLAFVMNINFRILAKASLFRPPFGAVMRAVGAVPIDRSSPQNLVEQSIALFEQYDNLVLVLAPEGTRKYAPYWKTGFYHIALGAGVPLVLAYIDYAKKEIGVGKIFQPSGDIDADMALIREFYAGVTPKKPANRGPIILKSQLETGDPEGQV